MLFPIIFQVIDDGDKIDEEEKLRRQRKLGEEKEAERQEHEEKKFKEKSLKQYQHRLNTAIYAEEDQKIKEDKVLQHELDLHSKNVTKHVLQEQVSLFRTSMAIENQHPDVYVFLVYVFFLKHLDCIQSITCTSSKRKRQIHGRNGK